LKREAYFLRGFQGATEERVFGVPVEGDEPIAMLAVCLAAIAYVIGALSKNSGA